ncbi:MAG: type II toxin-antitoxin system RelE/ParE family toxin [Gammaproteobacteria bacterium]
MAYTVLEYLTADGVSPFLKWRLTLDAQSRLRIIRVVERFGDGNLGDHKGVGGGVVETRIDTGPGFRIYYGRDGDAIVILLAGGSKKTQARDIEAAKDRWKDYKDCKRRGS